MLGPPTNQLVGGCGASMPNRIIIIHPSQHTAIHPTPWLCGPTGAGALRQGLRDVHPRAHHPVRTQLFRSVRCFHTWPCIVGAAVVVSRDFGGHPQLEPQPPTQPPHTPKQNENKGRGATRSGASGGRSRRRTSRPPSRTPTFWTSSSTLSRGEGMLMSRG